MGSDTFSNITFDKNHNRIMFFLYDWIAAVVALFAGNPLLLVFLLSIIGNVLPFVPTPSLLFIVFLTVTPGSGFEGIGIIEIASIATLGATVGKLASYALG
jgi:membrane protein DedA with SNARE-associated domain